MELQSIPIKELKEKVNNNSKLIESLEASGSISVETPEESNSGSIELRAKKPDSIFIKIEGPFGIDIATALISSKDFIYYNALENKVIMGPTNENNIGAILKIRMGFNDLFNSLTGAFTFKENSGDSLDASAENSFYLIALGLNEGTSKYLVEPNSFLINKYSIYDPSNKKILEVAYSKYSSVNTVYLPSQITISKPDKKQTIWISYDTKKVNGKELNFKIKIPKSAKTIKWDN